MTPTIFELIPISAFGYSFNIQQSSYDLHPICTAVSEVSLFCVEEMHTTFSVCVGFVPHLQHFFGMFSFYRNTLNGYTQYY
jgi:hypothetical protein